MTTNKTNDAEAETPKACGCSGTRWCALCKPSTSSSSSSSLHGTANATSSSSTTFKINRESVEDDQGVFAAGKCLADCIVGQFRKENPVSGCSFAQIKGALCSSSSTSPGKGISSQLDCVLHACPECGGFFPSSAVASNVTAKATASDEPNDKTATNEKGEENLFVNNAVLHGCNEHQQSLSATPTADLRTALSAVLGLLLGDGGFVVERDFLTHEEEASVLNELDDASSSSSSAAPHQVQSHDSATTTVAKWKPSQSGRRKQDWGPQPNFKKRKLKLRAEYRGLDPCVKRLVRRVEARVSDLCAPVAEASVENLPCAHWERFLGFKEGKMKMKEEKAEERRKKKSATRYQIVEASSLEYVRGRCTNLDPHIDDTWVWGPRIAGVSMAGDCVLSMCGAVPLALLHSVAEALLMAEAKEGKEKARDSARQVALIALRAQTDRLLTLRRKESVPNHHVAYDEYLSLLLDDANTTATSTSARAVHFIPVIVHRYVPQRSFFLFHKHARFSLLHGIAHQHVLSDRRVSITMREFSESIWRSYCDLVAVAAPKATEDTTCGAATKAPSTATGSLSHVVQQSYALAGHNDEEVDLLL